MVLQTVSQVFSPQPWRRNISYRVQVAVVKRVRLDTQREWTDLSDSDKATVVEFVRKATGLGQRIVDQPVTVIGGPSQSAGLVITGGTVEFLSFNREIISLLKDVLPLAESDSDLCKQDVKNDAAKALSEPTGTGLRTRADVRKFFRALWTCCEHTVLARPSRSKNIRHREVPADQIGKSVRRCDQCRHGCSSY